MVLSVDNDSKITSNQLNNIKIANLELKEISKS